jgi:hypothetical protein
VKKKERVSFTVLENGKLISNGTKIKKKLVKVYLVSFRNYVVYQRCKHKIPNAERKVSLRKCSTS